jgi:hypothetical protein
MSETETPTLVEPSKPSKLKRIKSAAVTTGFIAIPVVLTGASMLYSGKLAKMQLETAKLTLEAAKLSKP